MKMDAGIRVRTERRYRDIYNQMRNVAVGDSHELFFICACLGYTARTKKPLTSKGEDRFWSSTIRPEEWCCYYAMVLHENEMDFATIQDDKQVIARIEEYANAGMQILIEECLDDFLTTASGDPALEEGAAKDLSKDLLHYIYEKLTDNS